MFRLLFLIPVFWLLAACGTKDVPARLSCIDGDEFPSTWEDGWQHFNLTGSRSNALFWTNAAVRKMFIGDFSRSDNAVTARVTGVLLLSGQIQRAAGDMTLRVAATAGGDRYLIEWTRTSPNYPGRKDVPVLKCLGQSA
jgi:hypothetical protein